MDNPLMLTPKDRRTLLAGLADAALYRERRATAPCADCHAHPADLCEQHARDLDATAEYRRLRDRLTPSVTFTSPPRPIPGSDSTFIDRLTITFEGETHA